MTKLNTTFLIRDNQAIAYLADEDAINYKSGATVFASRAVTASSEQLVNARSASISRNKKYDTKANIFLPKAVQIATGQFMLVG